MKKRIFLASKGVVALEVKVDLTEGQDITLEKIDRNADVKKVEKLGFTGSDLLAYTTVNALAESIKNVDIKGLDNVVDIYVTSSIAKAINAGWHKFWILTGKNAKGEVIPAEIIKAYTNFEKEYAKKSLYVRVLEIGNCRKRGNLTQAQFNQLNRDQKINYTYSTQIWKKVSPAEEIPGLEQA